MCDSDHLLVLDIYCTRLISTRPSIPKAAELKEF